MPQETNQDDDILCVLTGDKLFDTDIVEPETPEQ